MRDPVAKIGGGVLEFLVVQDKGRDTLRDSNDFNWYRCIEVCLQLQAGAINTDGSDKIAAVYDDRLGVHDRCAVGSVVSITGKIRNPVVVGRVAICTRLARHIRGSKELTKQVEHKLASLDNLAS